LDLSNMYNWMNCMLVCNETSWPASSFIYRIHNIVLFLLLIVFPSMNLKNTKKIGECDVAVEHLVAVVTIVVGVAMVT